MLSFCKGKVHIFFILVLYFFPLLADDDSHILIFYHIPKTGGITVTSLLDQQFDPKLICGDNFYFQIENRSLDDLKQFKFLRGHFFFKSNLQDLEHTKQIVFIRDPIKRVLSEQKFYTTFFKERDEQLFYLAHFLPRGEPIEIISNHQCLFLSSFDRDDPMITPEMHLASAKQNLLNEFFFIGITEYFEESIQALYRLMEWQVPDVIPRLNATYSELDIVDDQVLEEIRQRNLLDIELYEFAKSLFELKFRQFILNDAELE